MQQHGQPFAVLYNQKAVALALVRSTPFLLNDVGIVPGCGREKA